jgi:deoxyribose-phosphate aldolase
MNIDFTFNYNDVDDATAKELARQLNAIDNVNSITAPYYLVRSIRSLVDTYKKTLSCYVDFPLGISDPKTRQNAIKESIKSGANCIDIVMPQNLACNRKYDKIREDVKNAIDICSENSVKLRYILEYRVFDQHCLKKICEIFDTFGYITGVFTSTGYFLDNLADNILASVFLHENSKNLNIFCTGNAWQEKHFDTIIKANIHGVRISSYSALKTLLSIVDHNHK